MRKGGREGGRKEGREGGREERKEDTPDRIKFGRFLVQFLF